MTIIYEKWRDLDIDPLDIPFKTLKIKKIISYPPAQNDVIECLCDYNKKDINVVIKVERSKMAEFEVEINHLKELENLRNIPNLIEYGKYNNKNYIVLEKVDGERLSDIFKTNINDKEKYNYLYNYGKELANIHNIKIKNGYNAKIRVINDYPKLENYNNIPAELEKYINFLKENNCLKNNDTFIHGDFHYANILWDNFKPTGLLDWEYSGYGFKEQDIAWACILRPTQYFMDNLIDIQNFLKGYLEIGEFNNEYFRWCLINGYCHFYLLNLNDENYKEKLLFLIKEVYNQKLNF